MKRFTMQLLHCMFDLHTQNKGVGSLFFAQPLL